MSSTFNEHSGIQVSVTPSQSAFFAGEPFSVSITFTNTREPTPSRNQPRSASFAPSHRRNVHSVSSAPIARPPTSPRSARTYGFPTIGEETPERRRRGLLGQDALQNPRVSAVAAEDDMYQKKRRPFSKSLSVSVTPTELVERLVGKSASTPTSPDPSSATVGYNSMTHSPMTPRSTTLSRDPSLAVHPSHPHARKQSVQDFQIQDVATPYSLTLDPISENGVSVPSTPYIPSPSPGSNAVFNVNGRRLIDGPAPGRLSGPPPARSGHGRKGSLSNAAYELGLGRPPVLVGPSGRQPRTAHSSTFSPAGTEILLWAYAQLAGTLELDENIVPPAIADDVRDRLRNRAVGRGSMDIGGSPSSGGFLSAFLPQRTPRSPIQRHRASPSFFSGLSPFSLPSFLSAATHLPIGNAGMSGLEEGSLPTLDLQPSVIAVDLALTPGESRTYTYSVVLPAVLPPTFRGKAVRFHYELVVGTSHAPSSTKTFPPSTPAPERQRKRVMKIPIRIYNHISVHAPSPSYDILWPLQKGKEVRQGKMEEMKAFKQKKTENVSAPHNGPSAAIYARRILASGPLSNEIGGHVSDDDEEGVWSCREAVEIITRNSRKASYDIGKSGDKVATLTLVKSSYRLGETITGVVELNNASNPARVLKFSAFLEAHEHLPTAFVTAKGRDLRRVHAEFHSSITPNISRVPFSLDVPSDGSPAFKFSAGEVSDGRGGLEWRARLCFLVAVSPVATKYLTQDGAADEWGTSWKAGAALAPLGMLVPSSPISIPSTPVPGAWSEMFSTASEFSPKEHEEREWTELKAETVECEIPLAVAPGNTAFRPVETVFEA